ncbi:uncharacterized protein MONBRDRAFT_36394 [Monosiga brevicollis MX1]|uniref:UBX domain-containing protein n=1 Tax=Monosiga brevicollis TaxID=81824 RepID=A9UVC5_MONBE|nr:uncharacterized protein MONBRDRAFT_36394 [Monosiga brevicollis MX1]EDQ90869.1 predicted protein [Monosiga brevicollis MX1]|eukprot:XP_001744166.1 hypothetical protein [Monosiga brevicollis MX1]
MEWQSDVAPAVQAAKEKQAVLAVFLEVPGAGPGPSISFVSTGESALVAVLPAPVSCEALRKHLYVVTGRVVPAKAPEASAPATGASVQEKLAAARARRVEDERRQAREQELARREAGKEMGKLRQEHEERQLAEAAKERRQDKEREAERLKKVREQIEADRARRKAEHEQFKQQKEEERQQRVAERQAQADLRRRNVADEARVAIRLPDGATHKLSLSKDARLQDLHQRVAAEYLPDTAFYFLQTYPTRNFTLAQDGAKSLADLELMRAQLIVKLERGQNGAAASSAGSGAGVHRQPNVCEVIVAAIRAFFAPPTPAAPGAVSTSASRPRAQHPPSGVYMVLLGWSDYGPFINGGVACDP